MLLHHYQAILRSSRLIILPLSVLGNSLEYAFKSGHLEVRPTFVRTEASTRGHVFVVMPAYLLERELDKYWCGLEVMVADGIDELGSLRGVEISVG